MKHSVTKLSKFTAVIFAASLLASCGSVGGFNQMLGISNKGIDAKNVETNPPLKDANGGTLPTPEGAELSTVSTTTTPQIVAPKIVAPKIVAPKIVTPKVVTPKPKPKPPVAPKPQVVKPAVVASVIPSKIAPKDYQFIDLFSFRSDMKANKLANPLATAKFVASNKPDLCHIEGTKFTCWVVIDGLKQERFITVK